MAADDYYSHLARQQIQRLDASAAQARADLEMAKANADYESAGVAVQTLADIEQQKQNVLNLHDQYVRSQQGPPPPPEPTQEEKAARPWDKMDYGDVWEMSQNSKYGVDENAFRAGMAEVARRRARGE